MKSRDAQGSGKLPQAVALARAALAALPLSLAACSGPPTVSPVEGEPVCPDFEVGAAHAKMNGGLRYPVQVTLKDGSDVVHKGTILGRRSEKDAGARVLVPDADGTLTVEWAQCENERAPQPAEATGRDPKATVKYECGEAKVYKTEQLVTKKGDPKSRVLTFATPPNTACWEGVAPAPTPDAGAPDAAPTAAPAADGDAGAEADAGAETDAGAEAADADAGATDAGTADAGATDAATGDAGAAKTD